MSAREALIGQLASLPSETSTLSFLQEQDLFGRLSALLSATIEASTLNVRQNDVTIYEAESRHDWESGTPFFTISTIKRTTRFHRMSSLHSIIQTGSSQSPVTALAHGATKGAVAAGELKTSTNAKAGSAGEDSEDNVEKKSNTKVLQNPFALSITAEPADVQHRTLQTAQSCSDDLILPHVTVARQKHTDAKDKGLNQGRMSLVSLRQAGGLYPHGVEIDKTESPLQAFQFATFLLRLRDDQERLKGLARAKLDEGVDAEKLARWRESCSGGPRIIEFN
ncbi:hypothetical protein B0H17DRAFT_1125217 [Mycena rosella]|uniref:Uncharacterized protein n=1 Tax=Mycena rosella TaxID=1033263 RepID=A0AAD7GXR7_MYCRO|nr:hypothetical protein B0H17DRAFT_1125217 [Mycena rosella]